MIRAIQPAIRQPFSAKIQYLPIDKDHEHASTGQMG